MGYQNALPAGQRSREPYPAWTSEAQIPLSKEEIEDIFLDLTAKFGFQRDSMRNMYDHLMVLLDSMQIMGGNGQFDSIKKFFADLPPNVEIGVGSGNTQRNRDTH